MRLIARLRHKRRALTLIELIMTIVVVTIAAIPLSLFLGQHIQGLFQSEDLTIARQLARFEMEKVNNENYSSITRVRYRKYEGYDYDALRTVRYVEGSITSEESLKEITVKITKRGSTEALVSLVTYIAKNVSYGL